MSLRLNPTSDVRSISLQNQMISFHEPRGASMNGEDCVALSGRGAMRRLTQGGGRSAGLALGFHLSGLQPGALAPRFIGSAQFKKELVATEQMPVLHR